MKECFVFVKIRVLKFFLCHIVILDSPVDSAAFDISDFYVLGG